ncbi:PilN domain-containing protein [Nitrospira sp. M1]
MRKSRTHLSLAAPGMDSLLLVQWGLIVLMGSGLLIAGGIWWLSQEIDHERSLFVDKTNELRLLNQQMIKNASSHGIDLSVERIESLPKEISFANQIRKQLGFSWTQFLNDLESTVPDTISMESVKVNFKETNIALSGSAKTLKDINGLVDQLETHPSFHDVVLSQHANKQSKKQGKAAFVLFTLTVLYESVQDPFITGKQGV